MLEMPKIKTPDTTTNQNMWAFVFQEIQRIHTEHLNPLRLRVYNLDSTALLPYSSVLKTLSLMFSAFLFNDFPDEKVKIDNLFKKFYEYYNHTQTLKKQVAIHNMIINELNEYFGKCLECLETIDNMLEIIRQKKGFGITEQVNFVINERASKALRINDNINEEILKLFRANKEKKKDYIDNVSEKASKLLKDDSVEIEEVVEDGSVSDTSSTRTS
jgi:hypothetical protein